MNGNIIAIGANTVKSVMLETDTLDERIKKGIAEAKEFWLSTDDDVRFSSFIGGLMLSYPEDSEERERIKIELEQLKNLSAMLSGISVNFPEIPKGFKAIGLAKKWNEG